MEGTKKSTADGDGSMDCSGVLHGAASVTSKQRCPTSRPDHSRPTTDSPASRLALVHSKEVNEVAQFQRARRTKRLRLATY